MSSDSDIVPATTNSYTPSTDTVENNASHVGSTETKPNPNSNECNKPNLNNNVITTKIT